MAEENVRKFGFILISKAKKRSRIRFESCIFDMWALKSAQMIETISVWKNTASIPEIKRQPSFRLCFYEYYLL